MSDINVSVSSPTSVAINVTGGIGPQGAAGAGGVVSLNTYSGAITLVGAGGASVSGVTAASGATITITAGGGGGGGGLVDSVNGLTGTVVLSSVSVSAASAVHTHHADDITAGLLNRDRLPVATTKALGAVQASSGLTVDGNGHLAADVRSVAGRTGDVTLSTTDISLFSAAASAAAPVQSVAGRTGVVTISTTDVSLFITAAAAASPVQSVAGRTGAVTISTTDVASFTASAAAAAPVQSVNGSTGAVILNAASVTAAGTAVVSSVNGLTGALTISGQSGVTVTATGSTISLAAAALTDAQRYVLARAAARLTN